jgi:hypothetical protein
MKFYPGSMPLLEARRGRMVQDDDDEDMDYRGGLNVGGDGKVIKHTSRTHMADDSGEAEHESPFNRDRDRDDDNEDDDNFFSRRRPDDSSGKEGRGSRFGGGKYGRDDDDDDDEEENEKYPRATQLKRKLNDDDDDDDANDPTARGRGKKVGGFGFMRESKDNSDNYDKGRTVAVKLAKKKIKQAVKNTHASSVKKALKESKKGLVFIDRWTY